MQIKSNHSKLNGFFYSDHKMRPARFLTDISLTGPSDFHGLLRQLGESLSPYTSDFEGVLSLDTFFSTFKIGKWNVAIVFLTHLWQININLAPHQWGVPPEHVVGLVGWALIRKENSHGSQGLGDWPGICLWFFSPDQFASGFCKVPQSG